MKEKIKYLNLKEVQIEERKLLEKTIIFLDENNIKYYIWAGSFLGAVRHQGFIPWDDDIDLAIPRKEYNELINILKKKGCQIDSTIEAIGFELNNFDAPFLKFINKEIEVKEENNYDRNIWIDIFPLDGAPRNGRIFYKKIDLYRRIYFWKRSEYRNWKNKTNIIRRSFKKLILLFLRPIKYKYIIRSYIKLCSKYDTENTEFVCHNVWGVGEKEKFPKEMLLETSKYKFEDLEVTGIKDYDKWLTIRYGDYMKLPPEDKRITHEFEAWRVEEDDKEIKE